MAFIYVVFMHFAHVGRHSINTLTEKWVGEFSSIYREILN